MQSADHTTPAEPEGPPDSRHIGLIGGLGVGAAVIYYRAIAAGCADRGVVPRMTIVHAHAPTALAHVSAGRIEELADYLAGFVAALRSAGATLFAIPAATSYGPNRRKSTISIGSTSSSRQAVTPPRPVSRPYATSPGQSADVRASTPWCWRGLTST
jgi:hypothetical protein